MERLVKAITSGATRLRFTPIPPRTSSSTPARSTGSQPRSRRRILGYGAELIEKWTGTHRSASARAATCLNDETFEALESLGFRIDSSVFFRSDSNRITPFTVNAVRMRGRVIEVPVTYVPRVLDDGHIDHRKFDVNWLTGEELDEVVDRVSRVRDRRRRCS